MNWNQISEACPKAFLEWVRDDDPETESIEFLTNSDEEYRYNRILRSGHVESYYYLNKESIYVLPFYFDQFGISIETSPLQWSDSFSANVFLDKWLGKEVIYCGLHEDRLSATAAGITKAFEIREQQLNEAKQ